MPAGYDAEVAELFRDLRAASGLSEADLASQLATRLEVVQALETGAIYALPPWNETCRIVTGYGALLNLDVRPLLRRIYAQVEAGVVELAPKPIPEVPFMPPAQNGARGQGSSWSSTPFNQSAPPAPNKATRPPEKASPFPLPFNEPMPGESRPQKASPFPLPFNEPAPGRSQSGPASSMPPVQPPKGPLSGFGPPPGGIPPAHQTGGPSRQAPPSKPTFSPDLKPARRTPDPLAVAEATRAKVKENLADAKAKGKPRRGLLKWGVLALVASGTAFGLWLWLSQADLVGTSGSQTVEQGASKDEAQPPTTEGGPDPRSRKADRLPGPS